MEARMQNPVMYFPEAMQAMLALGSAAEKSGVAKKTIRLIQLRASQINGCSVCVDMHGREMKWDGESDDRLLTVAAWRDAPYFTDAERAALALTESVTRLSDRGEAVPDEIWNEAARHYEERQLAGLLLAVAVINSWNRLNAATKQVAGAWAKSAEGKQWLETHAHAQ